MVPRTSSVVKFPLVFNENQCVLTGATTKALSASMRKILIVLLSKLGVSDSVGLHEQAVLGAKFRCLVNDPDMAEVGSYNIL